MPFIPHTEDDIQRMLAEIGIANIEHLFDEIPSHLKVTLPPEIPPGMSEMAVARLLHERANAMTPLKCFIGAGAYEHHIPSAVFEIASRGEFLTAYTPYQAEASQGNLQVIFEYQTMMASLMGLEVSNASLYDGASSVVEAILMAVRLQNVKAPVIFIPLSLNPFYRQVITTFLAPLNIKIVAIPFNQAGKIDIATLDKLLSEHKTCTALVLNQPNFFGCLEEVDALTNWGQRNQALVIGIANPLAMGLLVPPGQWGEKGADIACGEGQPLGIPLSGGGPYFGFLCCRKKDVRQLPGRVVGKTVDSAGEPGYVLTLQAREQHIRRGKATSNICTNQGLLVTAATIYLSLVGPIGLKKVAARCHQLAAYFRRELAAISQVKIMFESFFHELVLCLPVAASLFLQRMSELGFAAGYALEKDYPHLKNCILVCLTETKTEQDIQVYIKAMQTILERALNGDF